MSAGAEICRAALRAGVLLEEADGNLRLRSFTGPPSRELRELLRTGKTDVLAFVRWRERALAELLDCAKRIERSYVGAPLDSPDIAAAEAGFRQPSGLRKQSLHSGPARLATGGMARGRAQPRGWPDTWRRADWAPGMSAPASRVNDILPPQRGHAARAGASQTPSWRPCTALSQRLAPPTGGALRRRAAHVTGARGVHRTPRVCAVRTLSGRTAWSGPKSLCEQFPSGLIWL